MARSSSVTPASVKKFFARLPDPRRRRTRIAHPLVEALNDVPLALAEGTPAVGDKGHDSDPLRDELKAEGFEPIIPHRKNRVRPSRNDGRRLRRYKRRWLIERTNARLHCYRGPAVRWAYYPLMYIGLVYVSFIHMALQRF